MRYVNNNKFLNLHLKTPNDGDDLISEGSIFQNLGPWKITVCCLREVLHLGKMKIIFLSCIIVMNKGIFSEQACVRLCCCIPVQHEFNGLLWSYVHVPLRNKLLK